MSDLKWYNYRQNNSGGVFTGPAEVVRVQAASPEQADEIVVQHGVYFNGCEWGLDCDCCGDRWNRASDWDVADDPFDQHRLYWKDDTMLLVFEDGSTQTVTRTS